MSGENQKMVSLKAPKRYCFEKDNLQKCDQICEELYQEPDEVREAIGVSMSHILKKKKKRIHTSSKASYSFRHANEFKNYKGKGR